MKLKYLLPFLVLLVIPLGVLSQDRVKTGGLDSLSKIDPRPVVIFLHTDWCKYCQAMKHTTFKDEEINAQLDSSFYFVSLNGESKETFSFKNKVYSPGQNRNSTHPLAYFLAGGKNDDITFPSTVFLNANLEVIYVQRGFINADKMKEMLSLVLSAY